MRNNREVSLMDIRKSIVTDNDGFVMFWPKTNVGAYTSYDLREIADEIDRRNAEQETLIKESYLDE